MVEKNKPTLDDMVRQDMLALGLNPKSKKDIEKFWLSNDRLISFSTDSELFQGESHLLTSKKISP
jgi:hypothetical protein|tara:strand:- start:2490 stop:2684 length:195 start_codon:yes stop_codon:yes gene_type:complete